MTITSATLTLIFVLDPVGNIPMFLSILGSMSAKRRTSIIIRECLIAFCVLTLFLFAGNHILSGLNISEPALGISGGIILFLIAIKMIFPPKASGGSREHTTGHSYIVPLAIPLVAGPSAIATVTLLGSQRGYYMWDSFIALIIATIICTIVLLFATQLRKLLGPKGLIAMERLMGMVLTTVAVQMFLTGIQAFFKL